MLIAIMGEVVLNDEDIKKKLHLKSKLYFILDSWWAKPLKHVSDSGIYIIVAYLKPEEDKGLEDISLLKQTIQDHKSAMTLKFDMIEKKLQHMGTSIGIL